MKALGASASTTSLAFSGVGIAVTGLVMLWQNHSKTQEEARQAALNQIQATNQQISSLQSLHSEYNQILQSTDDETTKNQNLLNWKKKLVEEYGFEKEALDGVNTSRRNGLEFLDAEILKNYALAIAEGGDEYIKAQKKIEDYGSSIYKLGSISKETKDKLKEAGIENKTSETQAGLTTRTTFYNTDSSENLIDFKQRLGNLISELRLLEVSGSDVGKILQELQPRYDQANKILGKHQAIYEGVNEAYIQSAIISNGLHTQSIQSEEDYANLTNEVEALGYSTSITTGIIKELSGIYSDFNAISSDENDLPSMEQSAESWEECGEKIRHVNEALSENAINLDNLQKSYNILAKAKDELLETNSLEIDTYQSLLELAPEYINRLIDEEGQLLLNEEALNNLTIAKIEEMAQAQARMLLETVGQFQCEDEALAHLKGTVDSVTASLIDMNAETLKSIRADVNLGDNVADAVEVQLKKIDQMRNLAIANVGKHGTGGRSTRSSRSDTPTIEKETELLKDLNSELSKIQSAYKDVEKAIDEYAESQSISVDTFQSLISHAGGYLGYLIDEQGNLTMTREALNEVTAARIDDLAIQQATELIAKARAASDANDIDALNKLAGASGETAKSKWDLVYADLAALNLSADMNNSLVNQVNMLRQMADAAKRGLGNEGVAGQAKEAKSAVDTLRDSLNAQKNELEDRKSYMESVLRAITKIYDTEIKKLNKVNDLLKERQSLYESQLSAADSAINHIIGREINDLQKQLKPLEEALKDIEGQRQAELNALKDQNDEISKQIELQKLQEALAKARDQRTQKVYKEGIGWTFQADQSAVKNAQSALDDKKWEIELENQTKHINELYDQKNQAIQANIDKLNENITAWQEYKTQFDEFLAGYKFGIDAKIAADLLGADFEQMIFNDRESFFIHFKDTYLATQAEINDITAELEANQARIEMYEMMKEKWGELTSAYQDEVDLQNLASYMGADYESKLLSGRMDVWQGFKNEYIGIQREIARLTEEINKLSIEEAQDTSNEISDAAFKTAGNVESASGRIISAANSAINAINKLNSTSVTSNSSGGKSGGGNPVSIGMYASGTASAAKGWALVGEEGPELVKFKGGETVLPADETKGRFISLIDYMNKPDFQPKSVFEQIMSRGGLPKILGNGGAANNHLNNIIGGLPNNNLQHIQNANHQNQTTMGDITININKPIGDTNSLANEIRLSLKNRVLQEAFRRY